MSTFVKGMLLAMGWSVGRDCYKAYIKIAARYMKQNYPEVWNEGMAFVNGRESGDCSEEETNDVVVKGFRG